MYASALDGTPFESVIVQFRLPSLETVVGAQENPVRVGRDDPLAP
jgi:hypothetical protein